MSDLPNLIEDRELQADVLRAAHAIATAMANYESDDVVARLLGDLVDMHPNALLCALGHAHVVLRMTLDAGERMRPGFRKVVLRSIGAGLAAT
jgi:hypothetical protein